MKKFMLIAVSLLFVVLSGCGSQGSSNREAAADYPEREITLVVPFAAGGASDSTARIVAAELEKTLDVPVIIDNRTGGTGTVGLNYVRNAEPDGYTIGYVPAELAMYEPLGLSDIAPDSFDLIAQATLVPAAVTVPADAPYNTVAEFVEHAKNNEGQVKVGNSGAGSIWHVAATAFAHETGVTFNDIPFDGAAPAVTALMGGHIDAVMVSIGEVKSGIESGKLKALAVMSAERHPNFPDVPTLKEEGVDLEYAGWGGFVVPKGTPDEIKAVLMEAFEKAINSEAFEQFASGQGMVVAFRPSEEFGQFAQEQYEFFSELIPTMELN